MAEEKLKRPGISSSQEYKDKWAEQQKKQKEEKAAKKASHKEAVANGTEQKTKGEKFIDGAKAVGKVIGKAATTAATLTANPLGAMKVVKGVDPTQSAVNTVNKVKDTVNKNSFADYVNQEAAKFQGQPTSNASVAATPEQPVEPAQPAQPAQPDIGSTAEQEYAETGDVSPEVKEEVGKEFGLNDNDTEADALKKFEQEMISKGYFTYDKSGKLVPSKMPPQMGWEKFATAGSILLTIIGGAFGIPIPPINFSKLTGADKREEGQQAAWNDMQTKMLEQYNKLQNIQSNATVAEDTARQAGKTEFLSQGGQAQSDSALDSAMKLAAVNFQNNKDFAAWQNDLTKSLARETAGLNAKQQAMVYDAVADWIQNNPGKAASMKAYELVPQLAQGALAYFTK